MKVLFLGAGASVAAGYPTAVNLLPEITRHAEGTPFVFERQYLAEWKATLRHALTLGLDPLLLDASNPEIPLTAIDLVVQAAREAPLEYLYAVLGGNRPSSDALEKWRQPRIAAARRARHAIRGLLAYYFQSRMCADVEAPDRRSYLRRLLDRLSPGDVVITLNWDATIELTLAEAGRWSPVDGYRLSSSRVTTRSARGLEPVAFPPSEVVVLKLHGGVGWMSDEFDADDIYLSNAYFLQFLCCPRNGHPVKFTELGHAEVETLSPFLVVPSYLKRVPVGRSMLAIWDEAMQALRSTDEVEIWGYGLPESDGEVRLVLSVLRGRLDADQVKVAVHDPSGDARNRWKELLGPKAQVLNERLDP